MSVDELFQYGIRAGTAVAWLLVLIRFRNADMPRRDSRLAVGSLALLTTIVAAGGFVAALHLVPGDYIRVAYTATTVILLIAAVAVLL